MFFYRNREAFQGRPDKICLIPQFTDCGYTRNDLLQIAGGNEEVAALIFEGCEWGDPELYLNDLCRADRVRIDYETCRPYINENPMRFS